MGRVGPFRWRPSTDAWTWSPAMFAMLGYEPDEVVPTRSLTVAHVHPADRPRVEEVLAAAVQHLDAFTCAHRVVTVTDTVREVLVAGYARRRGPDADGRPDTVLRGWVVDRTDLATDPPDGDTGWADRAARAAGASGSSTRQAAHLLARALDTDLEVAGVLIAHLGEHLVSPVDRVIASHLDPDRPGLAGLLRGLDPEPEH